MPKIKLGKPTQRTAASQIKMRSTNDKFGSQVKVLTIKPLPQNKRLEKK